MLETLHIEDSGVPIYIQIRDQILAAIGAGILQPGQRMPTMREVAVALKIDLNTVRHAYDAAQATGAIVLVKARGTYVAEHPPKPDPDKAERRTDRLAHRVIAAAKSAGIDPVQLTDRIIAIAQGQGPKGEST